MTLENLLDRLLQYCFREVLEKFIRSTSNYLTKIVSFFRNVNLETNKRSLSHIDILYQSTHFLVVNKPPDLLINSNDCKKSTVQTILRNQLPALTNPKLTHEFYFAHRLDFSTSGILCIPLHKQACASLSKSFENHKCEKHYIAIVNGHVQVVAANRDITLAIGEDIRYENTSKKMCTEFDSEFCKNPRKSHTNLKVLAFGKYRNQKISKVLLEPITGRRHQLRLHCSAIGHPILGDYTYGSKEDRKMSRMYLHAMRIIAPNDFENIHIQTDDPFNDVKFRFQAELKTDAAMV